LYPDNPKCASCEIVGHCRLALDYLKSLRSNVFNKRFYFEAQLTGEETLYHTLNFVNAHQHLANTIGEKKYLETLKEANSRRFSLPNEIKDLPEKSTISPEKAKEIQERVGERNLILAEIANRGPSTISELSKTTGIKKSKLLRHLTAMRQFGKVTIVSEGDNQLIYDLLE
jgi:predicted transcriptional regulator